MDKRQFKFQQLVNRFHMLILFLAMTVLLAVTGWVIAGMAGVNAAVILACLSWIFSPTSSSSFVMRLYRTRPISSRRFPELYQISDVLAQRAGLKRSPDLYLLPGKLMNAFAVGSKDDPAICLSQELIHTLDTKEIVGILGHEISHIKNNDMLFMEYAYIFNRITYYVSLVGQIGLIFLAPLIWISQGTLPIIPVIIMAFAPAMSLFLIHALSRSHEYEADLGSAMLTGSPDYLIAALTKLEIYKKNMKRWFKIPISENHSNSLLRTHPPTKERIRRLQSYKTSDQHFLWT
nr:zinc metalloprotease HtpX [uncultured Desulfobacter sp.]